MLAQIYNQIDTAIKWVDDRIWGLPLIILILTTGIYLTVRLGGLQITASAESTQIHGKK